jgi:hypothetical protein
LTPFGVNGYGSIIYCIRKSQAAVHWYFFLSHLQLAFCLAPLYLFCLPYQ